MDNVTERVIKSITSKLFYTVASGAIGLVVYGATEKLHDLEEVERRLNNTVTATHFNQTMADLRSDVKQNTSRMDALIGLVLQSRMEPTIPAASKDIQVNMTTGDENNS
jgi:hypothetical protein